VLSYLVIGLWRVAMIVTVLHTTRIKNSRINPNTSVTEIIENWLNDCAIIHVKAEELFLNQYEQDRRNRLPIQPLIGGSSPAAKRPEKENDYWPTSSVQLKNSVTLTEENPLRFNSKNKIC